jgi:hypothetical protein
MNEADNPSLTIADAFEALDRIQAKHLEKLILVGGQASAFWITRYRDSVNPEHLTTKDIDVFLEDRAVVVDCAKDLDGVLEVVRGPRIPDVARIRFHSNGSEIKIDFLRSVHGVSTSGLVASKLVLLDQLSDGKPLYIMHPVNALASRLFNTFGLPGRLTEENLLRLGYSIEATRSYLSERVTADRVEVRDSIEKLLKMSLSREGLVAWRNHEIDIFAAVPDQAELAKCGAHFIKKRHPQMLELLQKKRATK